MSRGHLGTVLIGGGTGFIGTALTNGLRRRGYDVVLVSRKPGLYRLSWSDLNKNGLPESTVAVVSLAGQNVLDPLRRWTEGFKQNVWASRVNTTRNTKQVQNVSLDFKLKPFQQHLHLGEQPDITRNHVWRVGRLSCVFGHEILEECNLPRETKAVRVRYLAAAIESAKVKPQVFVSASGVGYYPPGKEEVFKEDGPGGDFDFLSRLCTEWEGAATLPDDIDVRTVKIRTGVVLGRPGGMIQQLIVPFYMGVGGPVGSGNQPMPWIHLHDIVRLFIYAIEQENVTGVVNGVAPQIITNRDFAKAFGQALWRPSFIPLPTLAVNLMFGQERAKIMTEGQKVWPQKALDTGFTFAYPDIKSAAKEFSRLIYADDGCY